MPNRILKESICTSENVDQLSAFQETFFYRLMVNCDDFGRMDARPKILASRLFPLKDIRSAQIEDALRALTSAELVIIYEVDGKPFLQMKTWDKHQQVRAKRSKYPAVEEGTISNDSTCNQMISNDSKCPRNPIQSESNPNPNPNPNAAKAVSARFEIFWKAYPKHINRKAAEKAFEKLKPDDDLLQTMLDAIEKQKQTSQWQESGGQFIPYPASWLNGRRWEDEVQGKVSPIKPVVAQDYEQRDYSEPVYSSPEDMIKRLNEEMGIQPQGRAI